MRFALLGLFLLGITNVALCDQQARPVLEKSGSLGGVPEIINGIIEKLISTVVGHVPDPLSIPELNISLPADSVIAAGNASITDFIETGLKGLQIVDVKTSVTHSKLNVVLNLPSININTNYYLDLLFGTIVPLYGSGPANIRIKDVGFNLTSKYTLNVLKLLLQLKNTSFVTTVGDATFDIHGIINNEAFSIMVCQIFDDTFSVFIDTHTELISKVASPIVQTVANKILAGKKGATEVFDEIDYEKLIDREGIMKLGLSFTETLMRHPKLAELKSMKHLLK